MDTSKVCSHYNGLEIAIIGLAGRFPGANSVEEFWQNLRDDVESISFFSERDLESSGISSNIFSNFNYIRAGAVLEDIEKFDASFFGFNPREAEIMDPQHRLFLECAWEALENAGYDTERYEGLIGVYAGVSMSSYLINNLASNLDLIESIGSYQAAISNDKDFLTTLVSYKLNLRGPSLAVQTACSTSLVATHLACQGLLSGECDIALAGGISIRVPQKTGYFYQKGGILSPDGHCRAFDAEAKGTVSGSGLGIVVLKRLSDAIADGDCIHAVIKGSAINNDGSLKVGYTAPSFDGQAKVIRAAQAIADVEPETITYIETHGTGTNLGDPIEIAALTQAFRIGTNKNNFCAIGSVKTNIGHLDVAAGIASLIKTVLALKYKLLPSSLHFKKSNPQIDFVNSPFYVNIRLSEWKSSCNPRRAGVSSFGIGGTNAHIIVEEAPSVKLSGISRPWKLLVLSAKTSSALDTMTKNLVEYLKQYPDINLADVAYTLQVGRRTFQHRRILVCSDRKNAVLDLETLAPQKVWTQYQQINEQSVVFMFPGQGAQYVNMALELYQTEPTFRQYVDYCCEILKPELGFDLRHSIYTSQGEVEGVAQQLMQTAIAQPALFIIEYALARLWLEWGVQPQAMIGHSVGEYVAACLAEVFSVEDALKLLAVRGQLMQQLPLGAMLTVPLTEHEVQPFLGKELSLAASNGPSLCVVSGPTHAIDSLQWQFSQVGVTCHRLRTSHAFHSQMMDPVIVPFTQYVARINLKPPQIPYISNVSGTWITTAQATDPNYWAKHLRASVRFADGVHELLQKPNQILLEVGPSQILSTLVRRQLTKVPEHLVLSSLHHPQAQQSDMMVLLNALGKLWLRGVQINWSTFYAHEQRYRLPLPTYPFERQCYWIAPNTENRKKSQTEIAQNIELQFLQDTDASKTIDSFLLHPRPNLQNTYVSPRDELERDLVSIWQKILGIEQVGIYDSFFDLGGHSLLAVQLTAQIQKLFGQDISLSTFISEPTIEHLTKLLRQEIVSPPWSPLVGIQTTGSKPPFFCVHPIGGNILCYIDLARHLGPEQPFYGLQALGLKEAQEPLSQIEDIAAYYIETLRTVQPQGPYYLGGWSFGGIVAFEMAQQLEKQNCQVACLILIDSWISAPDAKSTGVDSATLLTWFAKDLGGLSGKNLTISIEALQNLRADEQLNYVLEQAIKANALPHNVDLSQIQRLFNVCLKNLEAEKSYVPQVYPKKITLFRASERSVEIIRDPTICWQELAEDIETYTLFSNHYSIIREPDVQVLAKLLRIYLNKIQTVNKAVI
ncbi:hypothetical protein BZZ01_09855 [Nostocales cyanobacterium HT-58-2]|nr:hypothetical protein BZZ01_09855 [Nostocales cyanobacterium HT-58-2]